MLTGCRGSSDVVFVVDSSSVVDYWSFGYVKSFLADLVLDLAVDSGQIRVALVTYGVVVLERFNLIRYGERDDLSAAISSTPYTRPTRQGTNTADAIAYVRQVLTLLLPLKDVMFLLRSVCLSVHRITEKVVNGF